MKYGTKALTRAGMLGFIASELDYSRGWKNLYMPVSDYTKQYGDRGSLLSSQTTVGQTRDEREKRREVHEAREAQIAAAQAKAQAEAKAKAEAEAAAAKAAEEAQAQAKAQAEAQAQAKAQAEAQAQAKAQAEAQAKAYEKVVVDDQGNTGYTGQGNQSRAGNRPPPPAANPPRGGVGSNNPRKNYGVTGRRVTGGR